MNKKSFLWVICSIMMILLTISSALAVEVLSVSNVDYVDGPTNTMQKKFLALVTETPTGSDKIAAGELRDNVDKAYAQKDFIMNTQVTDYSCDYKFLANTANDDREKYYYTYSIVGKKNDIFALDALNCFSPDSTKNPFLKDAAFMTELSKTPGKQLYTTLVFRDGFFDLPYCSAVIREKTFNAGISSLSTVNWKADWTVSNGQEFTQTKTISSSDINKIVSLTTPTGKEVARVKYIASLVQPENRCPEASTDQKRAVQGFSTSRWDFISFKTHNDIFNSEITVAKDFFQYYNTNIASKILLSGLLGAVFPRADAQTKLDNIHNNLVKNIAIDNVLVGTETCTVRDGGSGKICTLPTTGKFPFIPLYSLEIQADWVGVIRPFAQPSIKILDSPVTFLSNEQKAVKVEVTNIGTDRGTFAVGASGECAPNTLYISSTSTGYIEPQGKAIVTLLSGASINNNIQGSCNICAVGNDPTKKSCAPLTITVKPTTDCGGEGAQQCFGQAIYQCSGALNNFDFTRPVLECASNDKCLDYKRDSTINKYAAKCVATNQDECLINADCELKLEPKPNTDRICNVPLIGIKTCKYVPVNTVQCNNGIDDDNDGKIDMADPGCKAPIENNEAADTQPDFIPWIALLGLIAFIIFGALAIKADDDDETTLKFVFGTLAILGGITLIYTVFIWLGLITMLLIALGLAALAIGRFLFKIIPQAGAIVMIIGLVLMLTVAIIIIFKVFLATTALGLALKLI